MAYSFEQIFAADPANPSNIAQNASVMIFAPGDATMTPITITDPDGTPLPNPIPVNANGFGSAFMADIDRVAWIGGGFTGFFTSYEGMKQVALDAQTAAESAATTAGTEAAAIANAAIAGATDEATAAAAAAATAATNAASSATAAANAAALVGAPADSAIATAINGSATATKAALNATYATPESVAAQVPPLVAPAVADAVTAQDIPGKVNTAVTGLDLVKRTDAGAPAVFTDEAAAYSHVWKTTGVAGKLLAGFKKSGGWFFLPKGFDYADRKVRVVSNDQYISASVDRNGRVMEDALDTQGNVPTDTLTRWGKRLTLSVAATAAWPFPAKVKVTTKTVKQDGTGDFTTVTAAIASITDSSILNTYRVLIYPGRYLETSIKPPAGVFLEGTDKNSCIIHGELPDSTTDATIALTSTIDVIDPSQLTNLTITGKNVRYPVHYEDAGKNKDSTLKAINCHIEHFGNQGMRDWRDANPGSGMLASTVWDSWIAWGEGAGSGIVVDIDRTTLRGRSAFYLHGSADHDKPMVHRISNSRIVSLGTARGGMTINPIGSGTDDELTITNTQLDVSYITHQDSPWQSQAPSQQYADHYEIRLTLANCSPIGWTTANRGKALRITSATTTASSSVRVSGTAAPVIFGNTGQWKYRDGGGGLNGYAYGYWDISGILVGVNQDITISNTLGKRLGNCATTPKTLTVTVDGGAPIDIVFNTDLTATSNATIISTMNTALGSAATASEYLVTQGERYPHILDKELELVNSGTVGVPRWAAVKYGADRRGLEIMGTGDPATAFLGVALEPIAPGKSGRVLTEGRLKYDQLFGYSGGITPGQGISLSGTTAGAFVTGTSKQLATGFITDWAYFKGNR